jgi:methionyl-tRNA formyltransferase
MSLRLIFMGTPDFSVPPLAELMAAGHEIVAVYSQPPRPSGRRGLAAQPGPVHRHALAAGIPVHTPVSLKGADEQETFRALGADAAVVVAYGLLLPKPILQGTRLGCFNIHASALPRWRGAAPIHRAIMAGDTATAVMIMRMEEGLDTGPVCLGEHVAIGGNETAGELHDRLSHLGASLIHRAMSALERGVLDASPQASEGVSYAAKIDKAEAQIDFTRPAAEVHNLVRGLSPVPGAWFEAPAADGRPPERIKVLRSEMRSGNGEPGMVLDDRLTVACGVGTIGLTDLQRAGKRPMKAEEVLRGFALPAGTALRPSR